MSIYGKQSAGRPTDLTDEFILQIRTQVLAGLKDVEICEKFNIPKGTWDAWIWRDYQGLRTKRTGWKRERMFKKSEQNIEEFLDMVPEDIQEKKIKLDASKFIAERLGKETYSLRNELTGKDGDPLTVSDEHQQAANIAITKYLNGGTGNPSQ